MSCETVLWRAVIEQALKDARPRVNFGRGGSSGLCVHDHLAARSWLEGTNWNFSKVCEFADLDPSYVRRRYARISRQAA